MINLIYHIFQESVFGNIFKPNNLAFRVGESESGDLINYHAP